jgi:threonylcarbamoyladenosine tRNA methylthiotransferase MtaB
VKYAVVTFGCRVNQADSLSFEEALQASGAQPASENVADVVIVNTCSVTATADQGARQTIRRIARVNPDARIVVTGCYATREASEVRGLPNVVRVVPNDDKHTLVSMMMTTAERYGDGDGSCGAAIAPGVAGRTAFTLRVQTGCAEPCSYCIIPSTRGAPRSAPIDAVVAQVDRAAAAGFKEIALTGVHLGSYGRDLTPPSSLMDLVRALDRRSVLFRVSSLEPMDCPPELVDFVAASDSFAPHFHLPLQHASDVVLASMGRPYRLAQFDALVSRVRRLMPRASIGSDIIVGFPGETESDADVLASYLESSPLTHIHVFPYSDRPGTAASQMPDKVHGGIVRDRARRIRDVGMGLTRRFRQSQVGAVHRGLTIEDGSLVVTDNYLKVRIAHGRPRNERVMVRIGGTADALAGEVVGEIDERRLDQTPNAAAASCCAGDGR